MPETPYHDIPPTLTPFGHTILFYYNRAVPSLPNQSCCVWDPHRVPLCLHAFVDRFLFLFVLVEQTAQKHAKIRNKVQYLLYSFAAMLGLAGWVYLLPSFVSSIKFAISNLKYRKKVFFFLGLTVLLCSWHQQATESGTASSTEVDLFISTQRIKVLSAYTQVHLKWCYEFSSWWERVRFVLQNQTPF